MADRRMFAKTIVLSDAFLDMPMSARCLYFTLGMLADDDGFVNSPKSIMRQCGASQDDLAVLCSKKFVIPFEDSGVIVIKHWRINNYLRNDRYVETKYIEEKGELSVDEKGAYHKEEPSTALHEATASEPASGIPNSGIPNSGIPSSGIPNSGIPIDNQVATIGIPIDNQVATIGIPIDNQVATTLGIPSIVKDSIVKDSIGKDSIGKDSIGKDSIGKDSIGSTTETDPSISTDTDRYQSEQKVLTKNDVTEIRSAWNEIGIGEIGEIDPKTKRGRLLRELSYKYSPFKIIAGIKKVGKSDFLKGGGGNGWVCTFDWCMDPENFSKILEGQYDNRKKKSSEYVRPAFDPDALNKISITPTETEII